MSTTSLRPHVEPGVDRVARRPRHVRDDRPVLAEERVEQARLADVRPSDEGDRGRLAILLGGHRGVPAGGFGIDAVEIRSFEAVAVCGIARLRVAHHERVEVAGRDVLGPRLGLGLAALRASSASVSGGSDQTMASSRSPVPRPCVAEIA